MSSVAGIPLQDNNLLKKSFHRRNDSGELDVFEAARYFSDYNTDATSSFSQKTAREDHNRARWRSGGRISLDMPNLRHIINTQNPPRHHFNDHDDDHQSANKDKTNKLLFKQPSSPGGRLASFLNSLFNQSASKKKKKSSKSNQSSLSTSTKDDDHSDDQSRRKRRSSISHFRSSISAASGEFSVKKPSPGSGFRTPPAYTETPTKAYRDLKSLADKENPNNSITKALISNVAVDNIKDERKVETFRKFDDDEGDDDGGDSDSSSDLFELPNYDLSGGCYSSSDSSSGGLPVYETTSMDSIKRGPSISTAS